METAIEESLEATILTNQFGTESGIEGMCSGAPGRTLADLADSLYLSTAARKFLALVSIAPWLLTDGERKLLRSLQHSDFFSPHGELNDDRVQTQWEFAAVRDCEIDRPIDLDLWTRANGNTDCISKYHEASRGRRSVAKIFAALDQVEAGRKVEHVARKWNVSKRTIYAWKTKYSGWL